MRNNMNAQDEYKATLLSKLDETTGTLDALFAVMDSVRERIDPAPARPADTVDPNVFFYKLRLHDHMEALFHAADGVGKAAQEMRLLAKRVAPSAQCRNAKAWGRILGIFSEHLTTQERMLHEAASAACSAAKLLAYAVTFAEADALPDEAAAKEGGES